MKIKFLITFAIIALVAIVSISCKKSCNCYDTEGKLTDFGKDFTKGECESIRLVAGGFCSWE